MKRAVQQTKKPISVHMFLVLLIGISFAAWSSCSDTGPVDAGMGQEKQQITPPVPHIIKSELEKFIVDTMAEAHFPGLAVGVVRGSELVWARGFGWAHIENKIPVVPTTLFMLASVSKTVTVTAVMQLWEQGMFELDGDINPFLPFDVHNPRFPEERITFRQLLTHSSSIRDNWDILSSVYTFGSDSPIGLGQFMNSYFNPAGEYYDADANFYNYAPGAAHHYCNQAITLSGYLVETVSGLSFENKTQNTIFDPLGMYATSWHLEGLDLNDIAMPYGYSEEQGYFPYGYFTYPDFPAGGLRSNVPELAVFLSMMMNGGEHNGVRILARETVELILTRQVPDLNPSQAMTWFVMERNGQTYYHHGGGDMGVRTYIIFRPEDKVAVIVLTNTSTTTTSQVAAFNDITFRLFDEAWNL